MVSGGPRCTPRTRRAARPRAGPAAQALLRRGPLGAGRAGTTGTDRVALPRRAPPAPPVTRGTSPCAWRAPCWAMSVSSKPSTLTGRVPKPGTPPLALAALANARGGAGRAAGTPPFVPGQPWPGALAASATSEDPAAGLARRPRGPAPPAAREAPSTSPASASRTPVLTPTRPASSPTARFSGAAGAGRGRGAQQTAASTAMQMTSSGTLTADTCIVPWPLPRTGPPTHARDKAEAATCYNFEDRGIAAWSMAVPGVVACLKWYTA
mmetsp:Transcript_96483/g.306052  ORF Transcript_96483/g.306052 Transcript_96483/m.306052 type:complete len:267 (+) Transcript_96483:462-1262(+)